MAVYRFSPPTYLFLSSLFAALIGCGANEKVGPAPIGSATAKVNEQAERCLSVAGAARKRKTIETKTITVRHILVKYRDAKNAAATIGRSREDACLRAEEARSKLEAGVSFAEVVGSFSDEAGAATREGMLGAIERKDVLPAFADAAFELEIGQVSYVVETEFGFHIIQRTG